MNSQAKKETFYKAAFQKSFAHWNQPRWLAGLRKRAFEYFTESGFPTTKDEEWKYTDLKALLTGCLKVSGAELSMVADNPINKLTKEFADEIESGNRVVFINGNYSRELTTLFDLPKGANVMSFSEALENEIFQQNLAEFVAYDFNSVAALNTAFINQGIFIHITKNTKVNSPIHILFIGEKKTANFPRILFVGETGSEAQIVEQYKRAREEAYFTNAIVEVGLADNAKLVHTRVQRESHHAFHIVTTQANLSNASVYDNTNITLGAKLSRHDINLNFNEEGGESWIDGLYLVEGRQHTDTHSRIDHKIKNCTSHQNYKGILDGNSRAVFNGKVFVHKNASGTDAEQSNKNLLLSNNARVDTKPQLEIFNDDVKCAHGATVGQLEEEELFYLLSRGLNEDLARNLLTYGFAEEIINKINFSSIKRQLDEAVLNRLHARLEA